MLKSLESRDLNEWMREWSSADSYRKWLLSVYHPEQNRLQAHHVSQATRSVSHLSFCVGNWHQSSLKHHNEVYNKGRKNMACASWAELQVKTLSEKVSVYEEKVSSRELSLSIGNPSEGSQQEVMQPSGTCNVHQHSGKQCKAGGACGRPLAVQS